MIKVMQPRFELLKVRKLGDIFNASLKVPLKSIEFTYLYTTNLIPADQNIVIKSVIYIKSLILSTNSNYFCSGPVIYAYSVRLTFDDVIAE